MLLNFAILFQTAMNAKINKISNALNISYIINFSDTSNVLQTFQEKYNGEIKSTILTITKFFLSTQRFELNIT